MRGGVRNLRDIEKVRRALQHQGILQEGGDVAENDTMECAHLSDAI